MELEEVTSELHEMLAYTMLAIAVVHIAAVIKHRKMDGWDVLYRMGFGKDRSQTKKVDD